MKPILEHKAIMQSEYMHWAKTSSRAKFNLATSGLANLSLRELDVGLADLEITGETGYGYQPLISAIAGRYRVDPNCIVTAAGTSFANHLAMAAIVRPGDEVLMERPVYEPLLALARYLGVDVKRFDRKFDEGFRIVPAGIEKAISNRTRLVVITNFHNPSGVMTDESTLKEVGEIARKVGARVLVDEVYLEMLFSEPPASAVHLGPEFVVTSSLTKAYGLSGLRCGWILAEPELAARIWRLNDLFAATPVHSGERLSLVAIKQLGKIGEGSKARLDTNRALLNEFLDSRNDLETVRTSLGSLMFPRLTRGNPDQFFEVLRSKYETSVVPGKFFELPAHFRIGLGGETETMKEGLNRLGDALDGAA